MEGAPLVLHPWPLSCRSLPPPQGGEVLSSVLLKMLSLQTYFKIQVVDM